MSKDPKDESGESKKPAKKAAKKKATKKKAANKADPAFDLPPVPEEAKPVELEPVADDAGEDAAATQFTIIGGDGEEYGPRGVTDVRRWIETGRADVRTLVRTQPDGAWLPLAQVPELAALLAETDYSPPVPGKVKAIGAMTLAGGIVALLWTLLLAWISVASFGIACCFTIPAGIYSIVAGILVTLRGVKLLGQKSADSLPHTRTAAVLLICGILTANFIGLVLGIVTLMLLRDESVIAYTEKARTP